MALKAHWRLDGNANDVLGNHDGTVAAGSASETGGAVWTAGVVGSAKATITCADHADFQGVLTYSAWLLRLNNDSQEIGKRGDGTTGFFIKALGPKLQIIVGADGGPEFYSSVGDLPVQKWTHLAVVLDFDSEALLIYVNGVLDSSHSMEIHYVPDSHVFTFVAGLNNIKMDDVRVYDEALDSTAIAAIFAADIASGPFLYTLGYEKDFANFSAFKPVFASSALTNDALVYLVGGLDDSGANIIAVHSWGEESLNWNGKSLTITTNPADQPNPSLVSGMHQVLGNGASFTLKKVKLLCESYSGTQREIVKATGTGSNVNAEDCLICTRRLGDGVTLWGGPGNLKNCTWAMSGGDSAITIGSGNGTKVYNNVFLLYAESAEIAVSCGASPDAGKNNTFYNYASGGTVAAPASWTGSVVNTNPNVAGGSVVTSAAQTVESLLEKDYKLTEASAACLDNADVATATATDIENKARD